MDKSPLSLFLVLLLNQLQINSEQILSLKLRILQGDVYINLPIGQPKTNMLEMLNQELQYNWAHSRFFKTDVSTTAKCLGESTLVYSGKEVKAIDYQDIVTFNKVTVFTTFHFKLVWSISELSLDAGGLAFPHIYTDERYSLVHQLKKDSLIDCMAYSIALDKEFEGSMYLGSVPSSLIKSKKKGSCQVDLNNPKWACALTQVSFSYESRESTELNRYDNRYEAFFQAKVKPINAPIDFMNYMKHIALKPFIDTKLCTYAIYYNMEIIECAASILNDLPSISFVFPSMTVTLPLKKFFFPCFSSTCQLLIQTQKDIGDKWVFGNHLLSLFITLFDYENHSVTLFADEGITQTEMLISFNENRINKVRYLIVESVLLIGLIVLMMIKVFFFTKNCFDVRERTV